MRPDSGFVDVNGLRLHVLRWNPHGPRGKVILSHATGFLAALWQPIADGLAAAGYNVVAYDARGHGDSDKPPATRANYEWARFVEDLGEVVEALGLQDAAFAGHSMGGGTGLHLAGTAPGIFSRIVAFEPIVMPGGFEPDEERREQMATGARRRRSSFTTREEMVDQYRARSTFEHWTDESLRLYAEEGAFDAEDGTVRLKCPPEIEGEIFSLSGSLNTWEVLPSIEVPVLVMAGRRTEGFLDMVAQGVSQRVKNGRFLPIPDAGHLAPMERPEAVAAEIVSFLAR